eukprot:1160261-Pelagomonas_calceolata.AAC.16
MPLCMLNSSLACVMEVLSAVDERGPPCLVNAPPHPRLINSPPHPRSRMRPLKLTTPLGPRWLCEGSPRLKAPKSGSSSPRTSCAQR